MLNSWWSWRIIKYSIIWSSRCLSSPETTHSLRESSKIFIIPYKHCSWLTASFVRLSKEWMPNSLWRHEYTLWRDHGFNTSANLWALTSVATHLVFDWRNQYDKWPKNWSKSNFSKCRVKTTKWLCCFAQIYKHTTCSRGKNPSIPQDCKRYVMILSCDDFCDVIRELAITNSTYSLDWVVCFNEGITQSISGY